VRNIKYILCMVAYFLVTLPFCYIAYVNNIHFLLIACIFVLVTAGVIFLILKLSSKTVEGFFVNERQMLYNILEDLNAMIIIWTSDLSINNVNDCFFDKTGFTEENFSGKGTLQNIFEMDAKTLKSASERDICVNKESKLLCADGKELTVFWKTTLIQSDFDYDIYMSIGVDMTEMTDIQNQLCVAETRYEASMELSEVGLLYKQIGSDIYFMSKNLQKIIGFESQNVTIGQFRDKIHPSDKPVYDSYCKNSEERATEEIHKVISIELRIFCADDGYHWFNYRYKISANFGTKTMAIGGSLIDISKDKEKDTLIEKMAYIDEVTQIFNRNRFMMMGQETYVCSKELNLSYWLIIFDVDKFHIINDTCGYQNGNRLLKDIAITILRNINEGCFCARIGGDNFAIILKDTGDEEVPLNLIQEVQGGLSSLSTGIYANQTISASAGYCQFPKDGDDFSEILEHAEFALRLGENVRSNVVRYDNTVHDKILSTVSLEKEIQNALANNELKLFYQPKIDLSNNRLMGAEALIRWIKPDGTIIPPNPDC